MRPLRVPSLQPSATTPAELVTSLSRGFASARAFFAFPSDPPTVAATVQKAFEQLRRSKPNHRWVSWRDLSIGGQVIFCVICRNIRFSRVLIADLTTIPSQLHAPVLMVLEQLMVPVFAPHTPKTAEPATAFLLDEGDYILADDFEVVVPEFTHDPSWFQPRTDGAG
jgi:hypothetical protein